MFKDNLLEIQAELKCYHRSKPDLKKLYLNGRLEASLNTYKKELEDSINFLRTKNETTILKRVEVQENDEL